MKNAIEFVDFADIHDLCILINGRLEGSNHKLIISLRANGGDKIVSYAEDNDVSVVWKECQVTIDLDKEKFCLDTVLKRMCAMISEGELYPIMGQRATVPELKYTSGSWKND